MIETVVGRCEKKNRQSVVEQIGDGHLPAADAAILVKGDQHGVGQYSGEKGGGETGPTFLVEAPPAQQRRGPAPQLGGPAQGFDGLPEQQAHPQVNQQPQQGPGQLPVKLVD